MRERTFVCEICQQTCPVSQREEFDDHQLCSVCFSDETTICHICGERLWQDNNAGDAETPLCQNCYDRYYTNCVHCGALLREDEAHYDRDDLDNEEPLCAACYDRTAHGRAIQDYYYKPEPLFYGEGPRFFGMELELDVGGENSRNAQKILNLANIGQERIYCKHDGSLNDGFEIVTHPMS